MDDLIRRIVDEAGLDEARARAAVQIVVNFLNREGPPEKTAEVLRAMPGAEAMLVAPPGEASGTGAGAMQAYQELDAAGLDMGQMQAVARLFLEHARAHAGEERVGQVVGAIPGLAQFV